MEILEKSSEKNKPTCFTEESRLLTTLPLGAMEAVTILREK